MVFTFLIYCIQSPTFTFALLKENRTVFSVTLPDVIFLDLNMPAKNGFECLAEIKKNNTLKSLPVIIFSTTVQEETVNRVYKDGASYYICKPDNFTQLKKALKKVLEIDWLKEISQTPKEKFIVSIV